MYTFGFGLAAGIPGTAKPDEQPDKASAEDPTRAKTNERFMPPVYARASITNS